jgi:hypothetical protein
VAGITASPEEEVVPRIAAVDMGYGHLRAARALADAAGTLVTEADRAPSAGRIEQAVWAALRGAYGILVRAAGAPRSRATVRPLLDVGRGLVEDLERSGAPLLATFYAPAVLADDAGRDRVWLVVTDADVNRIWVAADPASSRIGFLAPCARTARRLRTYGVPLSRIRVTGFPLPPSLLGDRDLGALRSNLAARLARLDPRGVFRARKGEEAARLLGCDIPPPGSGGPPTVAFAVGGSGSQAALMEEAIPAFRPFVERGALRLSLVAGVHAGVARAFRRWVADAGLREGEGVEVLEARTFDEYEPQFNALLARTDVLWTKPGELVFFGALGLPLLLAPPLGVHERRNRRLALRWGFALDGRDPAAAPGRLAAALADGALARAAWRGFRRLPARGTWRILDIVAGRA